MNRPISAVILLTAVFLAACDNAEQNAGGEAGTPAENISEAEPTGVGGTSNK